MKRERIEDFRKIVLPFLSRTLLKTNYENMGKSDAEEFQKDFNEILDLAIKALEQESILDKIRTEIEQEIEKEKNARHVFRYEKIDAVKAEQCTGRIEAYYYVIAIIGDSLAELEKGGFVQIIFKELEQEDGNVD